MQIEMDIHRTNRRAGMPADKDLGFGRYFTDHMFVMDYEPQQGWQKARVVPYGTLGLDPAAAVFHYGQAMFEGLKAFRGHDGHVRLFRADAHCRRMQSGAARMCMPALEPQAMQEAITAFVQVEQEWVPHTRGTSLYIRPTLVGTEPFLGVRPSSRLKFFIIACPVAAYYAEGINPVKIWIEDRYVRASRGGLGAVKAGANYAASLMAAEEAKKSGYSQVLWLDAVKHQELEEVGTMNLFVRFGDEVVTPPLAGSILAGITRDSVITLLKAWGHKVSERPITVDEVVAAHKAGQLKEVFGTGTAAVISPVGELGWHKERMVIGEGKVGELSRKLYDAITGIQYGERPDPYGWLTDVTALPSVVSINGVARNGAPRNGASKAAPQTLV